MSDPSFDLVQFDKQPVLGIIRGGPPDSAHGVMQACISAGLQYLEFTLNSKEALPCIEEGAREFPETLCVGAGTVLSVADAERAANAGAKFIVAPTLNEDVASYCCERNLPYLPGALTPTEIERAWNCGATMVKVFPANQMGPGYFSTVRGPFNEIRLMAVGGVGTDNVHSYLGAGASAVALGGSVFSSGRMKNKEFDIIQKEISDFLFAVKTFYSRMR
jgi:2-dehydro-3-deoxyphosphogluconate aldolase/(4S)-4-hydroxy-2-oxoglutarate aldolase